MAHRTGDDLKDKKGPRVYPGPSLLCSLDFLAAAAGSTAVLALVAASVTRHHAAAFGAKRRIRRHRRLERQRLLLIVLGWTQRRRSACLILRVLRPQELQPHPPENIIRNRLRERNLRISGPAHRFEPHVTELRHQELQRHTVLQAVADRRRKAVHNARDRRSFL